MLRFGVLGPVAVWTAGGDPVKVPETKVRALLADLLIHAGRPVAASRLIDDLWGDRLPANPTNTLQTRVSQLRRTLADASPHGRELVVSQAPGYLLRVRPEAVDAGQFRSLIEQARATTGPAGRVRLLTEALALWRGPAYADVREAPFARAAIDRLEEERLAAQEDLAHGRLALGHGAALVGELAELVAQHPLRQRLQAAYLLALYRAGQHGEALAGYRDLRDRLADQLGLDPDPQLVALQQAMLRQDPRLTTTATGGVRPRNNLPAPLTGLIGRDAALGQVRSELRGCRLMTLTGPGGVGKTRLAIEAAHGLVDQYADGVWLVELATVDPRRGPAGWQGPAGTSSGGAVTASGGAVTAHLVRLVSDALALDHRSSASAGPAGAAPGEAGSAEAGAREAGAREAAVADAAERLATALRERDALLVLDNCEHVIEPVIMLCQRLLRAAPGLRILTTSREPLGVPGEVVWEVPPLALPDPATTDPETLHAASAVALFVSRARAASPGFALRPDNAEAVVEICHRLDGIPLALELAATRVRGLGVREVAARLNDRLVRGQSDPPGTAAGVSGARFRLLAGGLRGAPARQQTLEAVIDWSWELLSEPERAVLRRLGLHTDSCTLAAAEAICGGDGVAAEDIPDLVARLVDRSLLVRVEAPGGVRYRLLESVGTYSLARLRASGEFAATLRRHIAYYTGLAQQTEPSLYGHRPLFDYLSEAYHDLPSRISAGRQPTTVHTIASRDGTRIGYDVAGAGPPLVLVGGALNDRTSFGPLMAGLASQFTVINYDRRGRGASGDTPPYAPQREVEDLQAVLAGLPEPAYALGFSSGTVLAVDAVLAGAPIAGLALIEPPFILERARPPLPTDFTARLIELVAAGRPGDAVELFLTEAVEMPAEVVAPMREAPTWSALEAMAATLRYDVAVMGDFQLPARWGAVAVPSLVLTGKDSAPWRQRAAAAVAQLVPGARHHVLDGPSHDVPAEVIGPLLTEQFGLD